MARQENQVSEFDKYFQQVSSAIEAGKLSEAEEAIEQLCKIAPNEENIRFSLADVRIAMGNFEGAARALEEVPTKFKESQSFQAKYSQYKKQIQEETEKGTASLKRSRDFQPFKGEVVVYPGLKVVIVDTISQVMDYYGLSMPGQILEKDIDVVVNEDDKFERARRDAEVITTLSANSTNSVLELGTSFGNGTYKLATNLGPNKTVYTVNILPEQFKGDCNLVTHLINKDQIGSFYRKFNLKNIEQIYENTLNWKIPENISNLSMVFIDAAHDTEAVYKDSLLTWERLAPGGYMVWHDFSPIFRTKFDWINSSMNGVTKFLISQGIEVEVVNLRYSWMGILKKPG